jgi:hypothetical protein
MVAGAERAVTSGVEMLRIPDESEIPHLLRPVDNFRSCE